MAVEYYQLGDLIQNVTGYFGNGPEFGNANKFGTEKYLLSLTLILVLVAPCAKFLYQGRLRKDKRKSFHRLLPRVQWTWFKLPILDGFFNQMQFRKIGVKYLEDLVAKHGRNFIFSIVPNDVVFLSDPDVLKTFLSSTDRGHMNKPKFIYEVLFEDILKDGIVVADFETWSPHRKSTSKSFTYNSFPTYLKLIDGGVRPLIEECISIARSSPTGSLDNEKFSDLLEHHSLSVTTAIIMGSESKNMTDEDRAEFTKAFSRSKDIVLDRINYAYLMIRPIWIFHPMRRDYNRQKEILNHLSRKMINNFRKNTKENIPAEDEKHAFRLDGVSSQTEKATEKKQEEDNAMGIKPFLCLVEQMIQRGHDDKEVLDAVNGFLIAGNETVVMTLNLLLFNLAANMEHQKICRAEVDELFDANPGLESEPLTLEHFGELKYLERCILESLRITPTGPFVLRRVDTPLELSDDCVLEAGTTVMVCPWALHRNPEIYPNPTKFDPDRFLPENVKQRHSHAFMPFSMGARNCIGWRVALLQLKVYLAQILRHFDVTTTDKPEDITLLVNVTVRPERLYNLTFKLREH